MPSPVDKIFKEIFGYLPDKKGTAFERLAAIASYLLDEGNIQHDARIRGQFSDTLYQIDVHHVNTADKKASMGEAKDYSEQGKRWVVVICRNSLVHCPIFIQLIPECFFFSNWIFETSKEICWGRTKYYWWKIY